MNPPAIQPPGATYHPSWYIERPCEETRALRYLEFSHPALLWGPRRQGRTWLWKHITQAWKAAGPPPRRIAAVDFRNFETSAFDSLDACLRRLAVAIADAADGIDDPEDTVAVAWSGRGDSKRKITDLVSRLILSKTPGFLLVVLDNADLVHKCPFYADFAGLLRSWATKAQEGREPWDRLRLLVSVSTHPARLSTDEKHQSPFENLSDPILVGDFERAQIEQLAARHGVSLGESDLERLLDVVGGQPYLARAVLCDIADGHYTLDHLASGAAIDKSLIADHLELHRTRFGASPDLAEAFTELSADPRALVSPSALDNLVRQGLIKQDSGGKHPVRYPLYRRLLAPAPALAATQRKLRLFYSYAREDEARLNRLAVHLKLLERQGLIEPWHDRQIPPGTEWAPTIDRHLEEADIILLLVSADFLASNDCYEDELKRALTRHDEKKAVVVPILLRPCGWSTTPFAKLQALPQNVVPVTRWTDPEDAWVDIAQGIRKIIEAWG